MTTSIGIGEKLFGVPWNALTLDTKNKRFVLNVEKDRLKAAGTGGLTWQTGLG
jgi:hypothetical protein